MLNEAKVKVGTGGIIDSMTGSVTIKVGAGLIVGMAEALAAEVL